MYRQPVLAGIRRRAGPRVATSVPRRRGGDESRIFFDHGFTGKTVERASLQMVLAAVREDDKISAGISAIGSPGNAEETLRIVLELTEHP